MNGVVGRPGTTTPMAPSPTHVNPEIMNRLLLNITPAKLVMFAE